MHTYPSKISRTIQPVSSKNCHSSSIPVFAVRCIISRKWARGSESHRSPSDESTQSLFQNFSLKVLLSLINCLTSQVIFTILRDKTTSRQDFVFYTDRLSTLLVEHALELLPHVPKTVVTPVGMEAHGQKIDAQVSANCHFFKNLITD